jgi:hypothetical protein
LVARLGLEPEYRSVRECKERSGVIPELTVSLEPGWQRPIVKRDSGGGG